MKTEMQLEEFRNKRPYCLLIFSNFIVPTHSPPLGSLLIIWTKCFCTSILYLLCHFVSIGACGKREVGECSHIIASKICWSHDMVMVFS